MELPALEGRGGRRPGWGEENVSNDLLFQNPPTPPFRHLSPLGRGVCCVGFLLSDLLTGKK